MELQKMADSIESKEQLAAFVHALAQDLHANREAWENDTLETYLEALASWIEVSDAALKKKGETPPHSPRWKDLAQLLIAAKVYE